MTSNFDKAVQDIAVRSARNGGPGPVEILDALIALNKDSEEAHEQTRTWFEGLEESFRAHCSEGQERDRRIGVLENKTSALTEDGHMVKALALEGVRRTDNGAGEDHIVERKPVEVKVPIAAAVTEQTNRRVWVMWGVGLWLAAVAGTTLIDKLIDMVWN